MTEQLTRGQKAARTRAANKAARQAEANAALAEGATTMAKAAEEARYLDGVRVTDIYSLVEAANDIRESCAEKDLDVAAFSVVRSVGGRAIQLTLADGHWQVSII